MNLNRVFILGNMAADPEQRALPSGQAVANFSVATNRTWTDRDGKKQEAAEFHRIVAFGRLAEIVTQYLAKGRLVFVEGRLQTRSWQAQDGSKRHQTEIVAEGLQLGPRTAGGSSGEGRTPPARENATARRGGADDRREDRPAPSPSAGAPPAPNQPAPAETEQIPTVNLDEESIEDEPQKINPEDLPF